MINTSLFIRIRGADIKEIELFMLLVSVWVSILMGIDAYGYIAIDSPFINSLRAYSYVFNTIFLSSLFIVIFGTFVYLGKFARFIAPWLLFSGVYWALLTFMSLLLQPFSIMFGVCAFLTTTSFHLFTLQVKTRTPSVLSRRSVDHQCARKYFS